MNRRRAWIGALVVAAGGVLLAACGVGVDASPTIVNKKTVPYGLLQSAPPTTAATPPGAYVTIYLAGTQRLVAVSRSVESPVTVQTILQALSNGPTKQQAAEGLESPVSTANPLTLDHLVGTVATVDVSSSFTKLAQKEQEVAVAQIVYSVTAYPGVQSVAIKIHGKSVRVPTDNGTLSRDPLTRKDYASFAPY